MVMAGALLALNSCQKEKPLDPQTGSDLSSGTNALGASQLVIKSLDNSSNSFKQEDNLLASCAVVTNDTVSKPHTYTVDYGTGCVGADGVTRSGKVTATYNTTNMRLVNASYIISFQNYVENNEQIGGSVTIQNNGFNGSGNLNYTITLNVPTVVSGVSSTVTGNLGYEWIAGEGTLSTADDMFSLTGSVTGNDRKGRYSTFTVNTPLISSSACNNLYVQGTASATQAGQPNKTFNYGSGTCTGTETVSLNGGPPTTVQQGRAFYLPVLK